jgi:prepilin-type N-terminal cleavage/methylation domain-containing protein
LECGKPLPLFVSPAMHQHSRFVPSCLRVKRSPSPRLFTSNFSLLTSTCGFSLLELVAAMTILVVVISILGRIVTDTQRVWRQGADAAELSLNARAAFAILDNDVSASVCSSNMAFVLSADGAGNDLLLHRLSVQRDPADHRAIRQVHYFASTNGLGLATLCRASRELTYDDDLGFDALRQWAEGNTVSNTVPVLLDNVVTMRILASRPSDSSDPPGTLLVSEANYDSEGHDDRLPLVLDIEVALLPARTARRLLDSSEEQRMIHAVWFSHRIYFRNREGGFLP